MSDERSIESPETRYVEFVLDQRRARRQPEEEQERPSDPRYSYRMKMGRETIRLDPIAFRLLNFLAARPYRAYTRRTLAEAISTPRQPVAEESLDQHILHCAGHSASSATIFRPCLTSGIDSKRSGLLFVAALAQRAGAAGQRTTLSPTLCASVATIFASPTPP